jgi:adenine/guanine phosphoribosyltransferase-like PRPP-binding protein
MIYHSVRTDGDGLGNDFVSGSFRDLGAAVLKAVRLCEERGLKKFDTIVVQGTSGMAIGFPLAVALGKDIAVLRKEDDHSCHGSAGELIGRKQVSGKKCLFVDDFVSMGRTRTRVREAVERAGGRLVAQCTNDGYETL